MEKCYYSKNNVISLQINSYADTSYNSITTHQLQDTPVNRTQQHFWNETTTGQECDHSSQPTFEDVAVAPYFSLFLVFFSPALIATAPHTWLSYGRHAEATRLSCSAHSASFASRITGYLVTQPFWTLVHAHHLSHQSHVTKWSVRSVCSINTGPCRFS
jgi:hypothetical protein